MKAGRELDALVAEKVMELTPIAWRICEYPPDGCELEEVEHFADREGGERHPCYNWLDTDGPHTNGWADEDVATTDRGPYWKPVPFYSTDIAAAWQVLAHFGDVYKVLAHVPRRSLGWSLGQPYEWTCTIYATNTAAADTAPHAICLAALKAAGVLQ